MAFAMIALVTHQRNPAFKFGSKLLDQKSVRIQMAIVIPEETGVIPVRLEAITNTLRRSQAFFMLVFDADFFECVAQCCLGETLPSRHRQFADVQQYINIEESERFDEILQCGALVSDCVQLVHQVPPKCGSIDQRLGRERIFLHYCTS